MQTKDELEDMFGEQLRNDECVLTLRHESESGVQMIGAFEDAESIIKYAHDHFMTSEMGQIRAVSLFYQ